MVRAISTSKCLLILVFFLVTQASPALASTSSGGCPESVRLLANLLRDQRQHSFTEEEKREIDSIFAEKYFSPHEKADKAFDVYMRSRLKQLPSEVADHVGAVWQDTTILDEGDTTFFREGHQFGLDIIYMHLPKDIRGTIAEYAARSYHLENAIQDVTGIRTVGREAWQAQRWENLLDLRFMEAEGAMTAEYQYLKLMPSAEKQRIISMIKANPQIFKSKAARELIIRTLENSDRYGLDEYLAAERAAGRNTMSSIKWNEVIPMKVRRMIEETPGNVKKATGKVIGKASELAFEGYSIYELCQFMYDDNGGHPSNGSFFQQACMAYVSYLDKAYKRIKPLLNY